MSVKFFAISFHAFAFFVFAEILSLNQNSFWKGSFIMTAWQKKWVVDGVILAVSPIWRGIFIYFVMISLQNLVQLPRYTAAFQKFSLEFLFLTKILGTKIENHAGNKIAIPSVRKKNHIVPANMVLFLLHLAPLAGIEPATNP